MSIRFLVPAALVLAGILVLPSCQPATQSVSAPPADPGTPVPLVLSPVPDASAPGNETLAQPAGWERRNAAFYHVWVSAFRDSGTDGVGDLNGITQAVDSGYFGALGVNALWLSPIFRASSLAASSPNKHGYDTLDYHAVDPIFGTEADLKTLLNHAHARGLRVIFDFVPNHTSDRHPWFTNGATGDRYVFRTVRPAGWGGFDTWGDWYSRGSSFYYGVFGGGMPDLNYRNPFVRNAMASVVTRWLNFGFDGLRVDAVKYLAEGSAESQWKDQPETYQWFQALRSQVVDPYAAQGSAKFMVAENWESDLVNLRSYLVKDGKPAFGMTFDFDWPGLVNYGLSGAAVSSRKDALTWGLVTRPSQLPAGTTFGTFQSNHDNVASRPATALAGTDQGPRLFLAAALSLLGKGTPFVYYGNETGQSGTAGTDLNLRQGFDWTRAADQQADPRSLWTWHSQLLKLRTTSGAWDDPMIGALASPAGTLAFLVTGAGGQRAVVVANLTAVAQASVAVKVPGALDRAALVLGSGAPAADQGAGTLTFPALPAYGVRVAALDEEAPVSVRTTDADGSTFAPALYFRGTPNNWGLWTLHPAGAGVLTVRFTAASAGPVEFKFASSDWTSALGAAELTCEAPAGALAPSAFSASVPDGNIVFTAQAGATYDLSVDLAGRRFWVSLP